jgi:phosphate transport system permease protein
MNKEKFYKKRYLLDKLVKNLGVVAIAIPALFLLFLIGSLLISASGAFTSYMVKVELPKAPITSEHNANKYLANYIYPAKNPLNFFSISAQEQIVKDKLTGETWLPASSLLGSILSKSTDIDNLPEASREIIQKWQSDNLIKKELNLSFFTGKESREAETAGITTSLVGTILTILLCILFALPISICTAIYLEEFAPKNSLTTLIEININNLAAVPSIVFGLLGLSILINIFGLPRSAPITAGLTLAMMILPILVITTRQALKSVPSNVKQAALALGATKMQVILHHTLPLSLPGIATGVILSIARAIGETAPLILIGMVAFIVDIPHNIFEPATALPVQIYLWSSSPEYAFQAKTAAAILFLLTILILINMVAVYIRKKYENRW